jgi:hypothetical protein
VEIVADSIGTDERRWLFALARGRLSGPAVDRNMPAEVRDSLVARGLVAWSEQSFGLTAQGKQQVDALRAPKPRAAARPAPAHVDAVPGEISEMHLKWLETALGQRLRGELVPWSAIPATIRAPLEQQGFIWHFEDQTEIDLSAVRALTQRGVRWTESFRPVR